MSGLDGNRFPVVERTQRERRRRRSRRQHDPRTGARRRRLLIAPLERSAVSHRRRGHCPVAPLDDPVAAARRDAAERLPTGARPVDRHRTRRLAVAEAEVQPAAGLREKPLAGAHRSPQDAVRRLELDPGAHSVPVRAGAVAFEVQRDEAVAGR